MAEISKNWYKSEFLFPMLDKEWFWLLQEGLGIATSKQKGQIPVGLTQNLQMKEILCKYKQEMLPEGSNF